MKIMATIAENLQIIKDSVEDIKQAIIDKGGIIEGDITTWADAISGIESGGSPNLVKFKIFTNMEYLFENGMTWEDFIHSIYNLNGSHYSNMYMYASSNIGITLRPNGQPFIIYDKNNPVIYSDTITPNYNYTLQSINTGGGS